MRGFFSFVVLCCLTTFGGATLPFNPLPMEWVANLDVFVRAVTPSLNYTIEAEVTYLQKQTQMNMTANSYYALGSVNGKQTQYNPLYKKPIVFPLKYVGMHDPKNKPNEQWIWNEQNSGIPDMCVDFAQTSPSYLIVALLDMFEWKNTGHKCGGGKGTGMGTKWEVMNKAFPQKDYFYYFMPANISVCIEPLDASHSQIRAIKMVDEKFNSEVHVDVKNFAAAELPASVFQTPERCHHKMTRVKNAAMREAKRLKLLRDYVGKLFGLE